MGRWRALALVLVHVLIALHLAHWLSTGETLSPLEPSESMQFTLEGVVNAGLILFALAIGSTLVLGRWFCGWTCHVVALQDLCAWLLAKLHLKPRPVRLGMLAAVPWLAFVYMFVSPAVGRWLAGEPAPALRLELTTSEFLETFPDFLHTWQGLAVTLLTFAVCGFAIVWLLGAKGFCAYACPYGGIFGVVDQLAPVRIRVTDACDSCGHCTATCTSNVNVSHEVRTHGAVVDPGCMKCLDCVSVCPKGALYVGWGKPALLLAAAERARGAPVGGGQAGGRRAGPARWALTLVFFAATLWVFHLHNGARGAYVNQPAWSLIALLTAGCFLVALALRPRAHRPREYTLGEEALLGGAFLAAMLSFRGLHGWVPFLFALGLSACAAFLLVHARRALARSDLALQRVPLKRAGRWTGAGVAFGLLALVGFAGWGRAAVEQGVLRRTVLQRIEEERAAHRAHEAERERVLALYNDGVRAAQERRLSDAIAAFAAALEADPTMQEARENLAGMLCAVGRFAEGAAEYERALERKPDDPDTHARAAQAYAALGRLEPGITHLREAVRLAPDQPRWRLMLAELLEASGDAAGAAAERRAAGQG
jgi:tetratricopeptide (TPR) repeat protein/ferredoxin